MTRGGELGTGMKNEIAKSRETSRCFFLLRRADVFSEFEHCGRLQLLRDSLCSRGFRVAVFDNTTTAAAWLSEEM